MTVPLRNGQWLAGVGTSVATTKPSTWVLLLVTCE